jgi:hypothetical protein
MLTYSAFVWLGVASEPCSPDCGVRVVYAVFYVIVAIIVPFYADCRIGLVTVMCALVLCVVLVAVFGYFTVVFVQF